MTVLSILATVALSSFAPQNQFDYLSDMRSAIACIARNYAGYTDKRARIGATQIDQASQEALKKAGAAQTDEELLHVLHDYTNVFRDGHVFALSKTKDGKLQSARKLFDPPTNPTRNPNPWAKLIGPDTVLVAIPDFDISFKIQVDSLLKKHQADLATRPNLIIDIRGNGGGSDATYQNLLPLLYTNPVRNVGNDILATQDSATAWEEVLTEIPATETDTIAAIKKIVAQMRSVPDGTFIPNAEDSIFTQPKIMPKPQRVAILMDGECASSSEEFLLTARQSRKVKLFGQASAGILDYANVRVFPLPSGQRFLGLPTSRSRRLPANPIDNIGIAPDVRLPKPAPGTPSYKGVQAVLKYWEITRK